MPFTKLWGHGNCTLRAALNIENSLPDNVKDAACIGREIATYQYVHNISARRLLVILDIFSILERLVCYLSRGYVVG